jgi:DNA-binding GntR family transcriptional regulator
MVVGVRSMSVRLDSAKQVWDEHSRLIDHLERREKAFAVRLIKQHVSQTAKQVLAFVRSRQMEHPDAPAHPQRAGDARRRAPRRTGRV